MLKKIIKSGGYLLLAACISGFLFLFVYTVLIKTLAIPAGKVAQLNIQQGSSSRSIAKRLQAEGLIRYSTPFIVWARLLQLDRNMQAGDYALTNKLTPYQLMQRIHRGEVKQYKLRFIEGTTFRLMLNNLKNRKKITHTVNGYTADQIMQKVARAGLHPAGMFFPDTYHFTAGTTDLEMLRRAYHKMQQVAQQQWPERAANLPYKSFYQALIVASLIETEAAKASERELIASVLLNRLQKHMRLQVDTTVLYGLAKPYGTKVLPADLKVKTPYNTYLHRGLPPTPIAMPGLASIHAALHPAITDYYYYVAKRDGYHQFSHSYAQHKQAIQNYLLQGKH